MLTATPSIGSRTNGSTGRGLLQVSAERQRCASYERRFLCPLTRRRSFLRALAARPLAPRDSGGRTPARRMQPLDGQSADAYP